MRFYVVCIGKLKDAYLREGVAEFVKRMRPYGGITITELNESKIGDKPSDVDRKQVVAEEGDRLLKAVPKNAYTKLCASQALAIHIQDLKIHWKANYHKERSPKKQLVVTPLTATKSALLQVK